MTLFDTSIWVDHIRSPHPTILRLLQEKAVVMHPFVIGELAMGSLPNRTKLLRTLASLPQMKVAPHDQVLAFVE